MVYPEEDRKDKHNLVYTNLTHEPNLKANSSLALGSSLGSITDASRKPRDGCIVLGDKSRTVNRYYTRFSIDRDQQKSQFSNTQVIRHACCPFTFSEKRSTCCQTAWQVIRAESFLISLHIGAIVLGAVKEALDFRDYAEDLELIHSLVETFIVLLIMVIRNVSVWHKFRDIGRIRENAEHIENEEYVIKNPRLLNLCKIYTAVTILMGIWSISTFISFYFLAHLGWTILSNNFALVIVTVLNGLIGERMATEVGLIREDQHKAVTYETILLLTELSLVRNPVEKERIIENVQKFCQALRDTEMFVQPNYIDLPEKYKPKWDALVTMETFTTV